MFKKKMIISIILKNNKDYEYLTKVYPQFNYIIMPKSKRGFYKAEEIQEKLKDFRYNKKHPVFFREADRFVNSILHIDNFVCARGKILTDLLNDIKRNNKIGLHAVIDSENPMNLCLVLSKKFGNTFWKIFGRNKEGEMYCRNYKFCVDGETVQDTVGETKNIPSLCDYGFHGSYTLPQAISYNLQSGNMGENVGRMVAKSAVDYGDDKACTMSATFEMYAIDNVVYNSIAEGIIEDYVNPVNDYWKNAFSMDFWYGFFINNHFDSEKIKKFQEILMCSTNSCKVSRSNFALGNKGNDEYYYLNNKTIFLNEDNFIWAMKNGGLEEYIDKAITYHKNRLDVIVK